MNKVICQYRVRAGNEAAFEALLQSHWPMLNKAGLVSSTVSICYRGQEQRSADPIYFELFDWLPGALDRAHDNAELMALWSAMEALCESRGDKPSMEFPHVELL